MNNEVLLSKSDPILAKVIQEVPKPPLVTTKNVFHDLMSCILEQQIHYRSSKKVFQKMLSKSNIEILTLDNFHQFETAALQGVKLSTGKLDTILGVLAFWRENKIDWNLLEDEAVIAHLSTIKGIGKWTIDMILLYTLERPNVLPYDDYHLKQIMIRLYGLNPNVKLKAQMIEIAQLWGDHKSLAVRYLFNWKTYRNHQNK
jgi:DNA-3-methyladenine glycosylase II